MSIISLRYLKIGDGGHKPNILIKESIYVATNVKEISKVIGLKINTTVHIVIVSVGEGTQRTLAVSNDFEIISRSTHISLTNLLVTMSANVVELSGDYSITTSDFTSAHYALVGCITRARGL